MGVEVPELTAPVARAWQPGRDDSDVVRDRLDGLWEDQDFAGWYPRDWRPGISPAQLAAVSVLQFLLDFSDRDAAEAGAVPDRLQVLDPGHPGFHCSVLGDFCGRLLQTGGRTGAPPGPGPGVKEAELVRERTAWHTDSTMSCRRCGI